MHTDGFPGLRIGVVIPAYRVERHIEQVIRGLPAFVSSIIVVEDASPDRTRERVAGLAERDRRITLLSHATNRGVGGAMRTGLTEALRQGLDLVVKMDGDDQMDPAWLPQLVAPLAAGTADMVKGNRYATLGSLKAMPPVRMAGNAGLTFLVKLASGYWNTFDPANGYFAVRTSVLERMNLDKLPSRYFFESGFLIELGILRAAVQDIAIPARYGDERSSLSVLRTLVGFPPRLMWGLVRRLFWRYFVYDFTALSVFLLLGLPLLVSGVVYGTVVYVELAKLNENATAGQVMLAAMPIILGAQLLLQAVVLDIANVPRVAISPPLEPSAAALRLERETVER
jgi:dolichol-phosphate mannosyltransferase